MRIDCSLVVRACLVSESLSVATVFDLGSNPKVSMRWLRARVLHSNSLQLWDLGQISFPKTLFSHTIKTIMPCGKRIK